MSAAVHARIARVPGLTCATGLRKLPYGLPDPNDAAPMDIQTLANFQLRRAQERVALATAREQAVRACIPQLVDLLVQRYGVTRVVAFGSYAWGTPHGASDLDLAVSGLPADALWQALADCNELAPVPVQLVPVESAAPSLAVRIAADGKVLHGD